MTALEIVADQDPILASWALRRIVDDLAESRRRVRAADPRQFYVADLPSPEAVSGVVKGLRSALFPRHAGGQDGTDQGLDYFVGYTLNTALRELVGQIKRELKADATRDRSERASADGALAIVREFAERLPAIREVLATDVRAAYEGDPSAKSPDEVLLSYPGVKAVIHHRLAHALYNLDAPVVARIVAELAHVRRASTFIPARRSAAASSSITAPAS